ncbi:GAD-like domain-containing protein [Nocardia sp. NPDC055053]
MVGQLTGQIDGLNNLTAAEVVHNLNTVQRSGKAQKNARKEYQRLATRMETENAERLELLNPAALNGLSPAEYARKIVDGRMKGMAALHEPDIIGGGADVIRIDSNGLPKLGDLGVNSSIGSQWKGRNHTAVRKYAEDLVAWGRARVDECRMEVEPVSELGLERVVSRLGEPYAIVPAEDRVVDRYAAMVPDLLLDVWRAVGFSGYADGLLWLCNPEEWQPAVDEWVAGLRMPFHDEWVPFTRTAFGTMTMWGRETGKSLTIVPQSGFVIPVDRSKDMIEELDINLQILVALRSDVDMLDEDGDDDKPLFRRLRKKLGGLDAATMYGCVPAVGLGGSFTPRGMEIVNAIDHVRFLSTVTPRQVMNWKF